MKIKTKSGFKTDLDERIIDDWRFMKAIAKADNMDKPSDALAGTVELVSMVFGENEEALMEHIASKNDGFVPQEKIKEEVLNVIEQVRNAKNSSSSEG